MLREEARWLGHQILAHDPGATFPLCNLGSSTGDFRVHRQPWIDEYIFQPIRERGGVVRHVDVRAGEGVDIVGDLADPGLMHRLEAEGFRSILCSNLLEHVPSRGGLARALVGLVPPGGYLFVSCPRRYPYHADPVDNGFRPTVAELAAEFPGAILVAGAEVEDGTYWDYVTRSPRELLGTTVGLMMPFHRPAQWLSTVHHLPWLGRRFEATCVVLRRAVGAA